MLAEWWAAHGWNAVPEAVLPKLGIVAFTEAGPVAACFLYMDNSVGVSMLEWLVSSPKAAGIDVMRAIKAQVAFMTARARDLGYGVMLTSCRQASLVRIYESAGFSKTDEGVTHLLKLTGDK